MKFIPFDANYFGAGKTNGDCVVRALCVATLFGYKAILKMLGKKNDFVMGAGYSGGVSIPEIDDFAKRTGIVTKVWGGDEEYEKMLDEIGTTSLENLDTFLKEDMDEIIRINNIKKKRFVFILRDWNVKGDTTKRQYHAVAVVWHNGDWAVVDVDERDNGGIIHNEDMIPILVYAVNRMPKKDSPYYYNNEKQEVLAQRNRELSDYLRKSRGNGGSGR